MLSPEGRVRRMEIRELVVQRARQMRRRRNAIRSVGGAAGALAIISAVVVARTAPTPAPTPRDRPGTAVTSTDAADPRPVLEVVSSSPGRVQIVSETRTTIEVIDECALVQILDDGGWAPGIITIGGKAILAAEVESPATIEEPGNATLPPQSTRLSETNAV